MNHRHVSKGVINRLARVQGQVGSLRTMVESGRDCSEVLIQLAAARAALDQAGRVILEEHMEHCVAEALIEGMGQEALDDLRTALKRFIG